MGSWDHAAQWPRVICGLARWPLLTNRATWTTLPLGTTLTLGDPSLPADPHGFVIGHCLRQSVHLW